MNQEKEKMARPDYQRITDFPRNTENPFVPKFIENISTRKRRKFLKSSDGKTSQMIVSQNDQEPLGFAAFFDIEEVDESQFVKVFANYFSAQAGLGKSGREVLTYLMTVVEQGRDLVGIKPERAMQYLGYKTRKPFYRGIAELLDKGVLARTEFDGQYYIDPDIMFNGNRVAFAKMFIKKKVLSIKEQNPDQITMFDLTPNPSIEALKREMRKINNSQAEGGEGV